MEKSRSDDTLLTVDFNLRNRNNVHTLPSPARDGAKCARCRPMRDLVDDTVYSRLRYALPTVNKVSSLRDFSINKPDRYFTIDMTLFVNEFKRSAKHWNFHNYNDYYVSFILYF